jgi:hypothetical protein
MERSFQLALEAPKAKETKGRCKGTFNHHGTSLNAFLVKVNRDENALTALCDPYEKRNYTI